MQVIHTLAELDAKIAECDRAGLQSEEAMRALLAGFRLEAPFPLPSDPFSAEYRAAQQTLYEMVTGHRYETSYEVTRFDVDRAVKQPFPFYTRSALVTGEYFMAIGFVLQVMNLPPGSSVLEFGAGWGWTSLWLAQLGHKVTVIDIETCFCELIARRAQKEGVEIRVINDDFFSAGRLEERFDAVLFYDCFHHCDDHLRLLGMLGDIVTPEGRLYFGGEPIEAGFSFPWGLRLDGWALWGVRKNGWMELGFRDDYFAAALARTGWFGVRHGVEGHNRLRVWEARRREGLSFRFEAGAGQLQTQTGRVEQGLIVVDGRRKGTALYGPYMALPPGDYLARIGFAPGARRQGRAEMDVCCNGGSRRLAMRRLSGAEPAELPFTLVADAGDLEVRLFAERGFEARIAFVEITPR